MKNKETKQKRAKVVVEKLKELFPEINMALGYDNNWQLLVSVVLSAQTTDKKVNEVTEKLFDKYPNLEDYLDLTKEELGEEINSIGLYNSKAGYVLDSAKMIKEEFGGEIPKNMKNIRKLPGVGRKTANVVLTEAYGQAEGIAVDTHVQRLSRKFGITDHKSPKKIEQDLVKIIPESEWKEFTLRMIQYGREYSPAYKFGDDSDPITQELKKQDLL